MKCVHLCELWCLVQISCMITRLIVYHCTRVMWQPIPRTLNLLYLVYLLLLVVVLIKVKIHFLTVLLFEFVVKMPQVVSQWHSWHFAEVLRCSLRLFRRHRVWCSTVVLWNYVHSICKLAEKPSWSKMPNVLWLWRLARVDDEVTLRMRYCPPWMHHRGVRFR